MPRRNERTGPTERVGTVRVTYRQGESGPATYGVIRESDFRIIQWRMQAYRLADQLSVLVSNDTARTHTRDIFHQAGISISSLGRSPQPTRPTYEVTLFRVRAGNTGITVVRQVHLPLTTFLRVEFVDAVTVPVNN